jgi:co-chaperonin GroES (HSP10)
MNLHPLGQRVLIKRKNIDKVGSIYIPKGSQEAECCIGEVVSVGPDCEFLKEGDLITFGRYAPLKILKQELDLYQVEITFDPDTTYLLMNEADALCIISDESLLRIVSKEEA